MALSSGNSSTQVQNSGSDGGLNQVITDQRKRKRMQSNRESARRSRMRKQQHLDGLMNQVCQLKVENSQIMTGINNTMRKYLNVEVENSILRAQMAELSHRLQSLNELTNFINSNTLWSQSITESFIAPEVSYESVFDEHGWFTNPLNISSSGNSGFSYFNHQMVALADMFLC